MAHGSGLGGDDGHGETKESTNEKGAELQCGTMGDCTDSGDSNISLMCWWILRQIHDLFMISKAAEEVKGRYELREICLRMYP